MLIAAIALVDSLAMPHKVLAARRTKPASLAGHWEFAGGKVEPGEAPAAAARREAREELGIDVRLGETLGGRWPLTGEWEMMIWWAELAKGAAEPKALDVHDQLRWLTAGELYQVPWLRADLPIVREIEQALGCSS